jgi:hypothetical protein
VSAAAVARPRRTRVVPLYRGKDADQQLRRERGAKGKWMGIPNSFAFYLPFICAGQAQEHVVRFVQIQTAGMPSKLWEGTRPPKWTAPLADEDFAALSPFSEPMMGIAIELLIGRGVMERKCGCAAATDCLNVNQDHYRYRLCCEKWDDIPNVQKSRPEAFKKRGEEEANTGQSAVIRMPIGRPVNLRPATYELEAPAAVIQFERAQGASDQVVATVTEEGVRISQRPSLQTADKPAEKRQPADNAPPPAPASERAPSDLEQLFETVERIQTAFPKTAFSAVPVNRDNDGDRTTLRNIARIIGAGNVQHFHLFVAAKFKGLHGSRQRNPEDADGPQSLGLLTLWARDFAAARGRR